MTTHPRRVSRRTFLAAAGAASLLPRPAAPQGAGADTPARLLALRTRFPDLRRRFVFEYYPWYGADPWRHWDQWGRRPPSDLAANYVPRLGAYDSRDRRVLEQHARWIAESGVGAVNVSWWGGGSYEDRAAHQLLDVMRDHDLKVAFHVEPYRRDRAERFADDVLYLLRVFGEERRFDAFHLLRDPSGREGPVFKGFSMILPRRMVDCRGVTRPVAAYVPDPAWRSQLDTLRELLRRDFPGLLLLADTVNVTRAAAAGFDGIAVYDNYVSPETYRDHAEAASRADLLFSFNVNPGFHGIMPRRFLASDCNVWLPFAPPVEGLDLSQTAGREQAAAASARRIRDSFAATVEVQSDPALANAERGFFLAYLNSWNEWHEGHAFEPMKDAADLSPAERAWPYDNPVDGGYRLAVLRELLR